MVVQREVDEVLAALEIQVDRGRRREASLVEQHVFRGKLLAHDDDLLPLARRGVIAHARQFARRLQELLLVAPHEEHLEQLQLQLATLRLALDRRLHKVGGLVIETIGHVEVGLGERVALLGYRLIVPQRLLHIDGARLARGA